MTVYVDTVRIPDTVVGRTGRWSHLTADSRDELHRLATRIGLQRAWFQDPPRPGGGPGVHWHYDVTDPKRDAAIAAGAQPITRRELGQLLGARRASPGGEARPPVPRRIQLRRSKGWRLGDNTVVVARPTRWGNPFALCAGIPGQPGHTGVADRFTAVAIYAAHTADWTDAARREARRRLGGLDLACWCPLDQPCHADVLLDIANTPDMGEPTSTGEDAGSTAPYPAPDAQEIQRVSHVHR